MARLEKEGIKLNPMKIKYKQSEVKYLGHILTTEGIKTDPEKVKAIKEA